MNNFLLKKILYCLVLLLLTCIITLSLSIPDHIKWELTGLYFTIGIITIALFYILQKNNLSGSIINLTTKRNKILLNTLSPISIILSIYVIPYLCFINSINIFLFREKKNVSPFSWQVLQYLPAFLFQVRFNKCFP